MTTSGIYTVQYTRDDLVTAAMRKMGVLSQGQTPTAANYTDGTMALNMAVGLFRTFGMPLWARTTFSFSPTVGVSTYAIGIGHTFNAPYPLKILQLYRTQDGTVINMDIEGDYTFNQLPTNSTGIPIKGAYQPLVGYGLVKLWPTPDDSATDSTFTVVYQRPFQYFIASTDIADFPNEWYLPLVYQTAVLWAPEWGLPLQDREKLNKELDTYLAATLSMGGEDASMFVQPYRQP